MSYSGLPKHCNPTSPYLIRLSSAFHSCVPTHLAFVSTSLGVFSIISWLFAQMPQIYKNFQLQSASGLSIYFLAEWLFGDLTNLLGALLTRQATWQVVVASYYVSVDVILVTQYIWYSRLKFSRSKSRLSEYGEANNRRDGSSEDVIVGVSPSEGDSVSGSISTGDGKDCTKTTETPTKPRDVPDPLQSFTFSPPSEKFTPSPSHRTIKRLQSGPPPAIASPKTFLLISMLFVILTSASPLQVQDPPSPPPSPSEFAGRILSWISTVLYLGSRLPQIYKNAVRRSTSGLSPTLFIAAFFGNLFYSTSLLTNPLGWGSYPPYGLHGWVGADGSDRMTWIALAAPFWLGAAGVLALDATIGVQFLVYGEDKKNKSVLVSDERGRSQWRRVKGWMRGWVPSPSSTSRVGETTEDDRRQLVRDGEGRERNYGTA
ncbi:hypothetical protein MMC28_007175 [Mycoblastus sanguinarius]|nr:hypothetical protein [Mycoblastus sanguinarius]